MNLEKNMDNSIKKDLSQYIKNGDRSISDRVKDNDPELIIQGSIQRETCKDLKKVWKEITKE